MKKILLFAVFAMLVMFLAQYECTRIDQEENGRKMVQIQVEGFKPIDMTMAGWLERDKLEKERLTKQ